MTDDAHYLIPAAMLHGLLAYLGRRPYAEVAQAMRALEALQLASGSAPDPEPVEPELSLSPQPEDLS
jgi:hypothetical protein